MMLLEQRQGLPLELKITMTCRRIHDWYGHFHGDVYVSFSGGKDSTVLLHLVKDVCGLDDVPAVFCDTGLEYPEVREFAIAHADEVILPKMSFKKVIEKYGYPVISKEQSSYIYQYRHTKNESVRNMRLHGSTSRGGFKISDKWLYLLNAPFEIGSKCCDVMKKNPAREYERRTGRVPYFANMACESSLRKQQYIKYGCNAYDMARPRSNPMGFWTEQDVLEYIRGNDLDYASVYGDIIECADGRLQTTGADRTGCMFCMYGVQSESEPNRFQRMAETHPRQYEYCMGKLGMKDVLEYIDVPYKPIHRHGLI